MKFDITKILSEWAYRVDDGQPNQLNTDHVNVLREVLYNFGLPYKFINEYVSNIQEIDFRSVGHYKKYKSKHKMRKTTKVNIAGKDTTAGEADSAEKGSSTTPNDTSKYGAKQKGIGAGFDNLTGPTSDAESITGDAEAERKLVDKLKSLTKENNIDLCTISVPGTNLFCAGNKQVPRDEMPQLKSKIIPGGKADQLVKAGELEIDPLNGEVNTEPLFKAMLEKEGISMGEPTPRNVTSLKATQNELVGAKVNMFAKVLAGDKPFEISDEDFQKFQDILREPIIVSKDGYILDGHHRWAAMVQHDLANGGTGDVEMDVKEVDLGAEELVDKTNKFTSDMGLATKSGTKEKNATVEKNIKVATKVNKELGAKINKTKGPEREKHKAEYLANQLDNMLKVSSIDKGTGRYHMTKEDTVIYRDYLKKISADPVNGAKKIIDTIKQEQERKYGPITEANIDKFITNLETSAKSGNPDFVKGIKTKIKGKGGPGSSYTTFEAGAQRYRNVIRAYLETGGISPITGKVVPFSEAQLDHITSLGNGGEDEPSNWMFMEERFNQFKGKKTHENVSADIESAFWETDAEIAAGKEGKDVEKLLIREDRGWFQNKFENVKGSDNPREIGLTKSQIEKMNKYELNNIVYGYNLANPDTPELARYENPTVEFAGKQLSFARGEGKDKPVRPEESDPNTWGLSVDSNKKVNQDKSMNYKDSLKAYNDNRASGARLKKADVFVKLLLTPPPEGYGLASDSAELDELFDNELKSHRTKQKVSVADIKKKIKAVEALPGSHRLKEKEVDASLKAWEKAEGNHEPYGKNDPDNDHLNWQARQKAAEWKKWKNDQNKYRYELWSKYEDKE